MKVYEFGDRRKPILVLIPGTCCHWKNTFGKVIEGLQRSFFVACVSFDGFDETEETIFPTETEETARIEDYIASHYSGRVCAVYGCSLGGSIVGLMAARGRIHMDYGILGGSDLDQAGELAAKLQTALMLKLLLPLLRTGRLKSDGMQRFYEKRIAKRGAYGQAMMDMFGIGHGGLPFVQAESVRNQFYSDLVTVLPDAIDPPETEIHILYALKMGEKYRARYQKHFAHPVLHELDMQHEELLAVYPQEWVKTIETICKAGGAA